MMRPQKNDQMHPQDMRNLIIFCVASLLIYLAYDTFILKPQTQALLEARRAQTELAKITPPADAAADRLEKQTFITRHAAIQGGPRIAIQTPEIKGSLMLRGAQLDDISLREFFQTLEKKDNVVILQPENTEHARYIQHGWVSDDETLRLPDSETLWQVRGAHEALTPTSPVTLFWDNGQGVIFELAYEIDEDYLISLKQRVINNSGKEIDVFPYGLISQKGLSLSGQQSWLQHEGPIGYVENQLHEITYGALRKQLQSVFEGMQGWIGITDKYWLTSLVPPQGQVVKYRFTRTGQPSAKGEPDRSIYQTDYTASGVKIPSGQSAETASHIFAGAKKVLVLERYEDKLQIPKFSLAVNFGWFWFLALPFFYALHYLNELTGNMGVAIIFLTVVIRSAVFPLTNASYKSFAKMKKVSPQVAELRDKFGDDKQRLQKELVELYSREGVNPMAGCIPILLQIPIFFALYKVLFVTIEMRHAPFFGWIKDLSAPDPTTFLNLFGLIPWEPPSFLHVGIWPCLLLVAYLIQKKLNPPPQDPMQRDIAMYLPFVMTYLLSQFASGLVIYWTFSAYLGLAQQIIIMRSMNVPIYLFGQTEDEERIDKSLDKGQSAHPLAEMAESDLEEAFFGEGHDDENPPKPVTPPKPRKKKKKK